MIYFKSYFCIYLIIFDITVLGEIAELREESSLWKPLWTDILKKELLTSYDNYVRPAPESHITNVSIDLELMHINLDDIDSKMTLNGYTYLVWFDEKLRWNSSDYNNLKMIHTGDHEVWQPDICIWNRNMDNNIQFFGSVPLIVKDTGEITWETPSQFTVFCEINLFYWPFDIQTCEIKLSSCSYNSSNVDLYSQQPKPIIDEIKIIQWNLLNINVEKSSIESKNHEKSVIKYIFVLARIVDPYYVLVIYPTVVLSVIAIIVFLIPPFHYHKFISASIAIFLVSIFLNNILKKIPEMGKIPPLIVTFHGITMVLLSLSLVMSIITFNLPSSKRNMRTNLSNIFGNKFFHVFQITQEKVGETTSDETSTNKHANVESQTSASPCTSGDTTAWNLIALIFDRIIGISYLCLLGFVFVKFITR